MYFLVDYENVKENGFSGFEHLTSNDDVLIFFSESTSKIKQGVWKKLCDTGCSIEICKLAKVRKNGLDFYIASRVGEIVAQDPSERIAIISGDSGFMAVVDYWQKCRGNKHSVVVGNTISMGFLYSNYREKYLGALKRYGRKDGLNIYRFVKKVV